MIKVYKSPDAPSSLATTTRYDGEDVKFSYLRISMTNAIYVRDGVIRIMR